MKNIIILMGGQGTGKGTFAKILCGCTQYNHIETGALFRAMPENCTIAKLIAAGELVPDDELFKLIKSKINQNNDILIDGFPRTLPQANWLIKNYADDFNITILYLNVSREIMLSRIKKRRGDGENRADDNEMDIINRRIDSFFNKTMPAIDWLSGLDSVKFCEIDASGNLDENMILIRRALGQIL